jgi:hypothetical protein
MRADPSDVGSCVATRTVASTVATRVATPVTLQVLRVGSESYFEAGSSHPLAAGRLTISRRDCGSGYLRAVFRQGVPESIRKDDSKAIAWLNRGRAVGHGGRWGGDTRTYPLGNFRENGGRQPIEF